MNVEYYGYHLTLKFFFLLLGQINQLKKKHTLHFLHIWMFKPGVQDFFHLNEHPLPSSQRSSHSADEADQINLSVFHSITELLNGVGGDFPVLTHR